MSMYDCASCGEKRCEHVIEDMDKADEKMKQIREYCDPHLDKMWAAVIAGIIDDCEFRDVKSLKESRAAL